MFWSKETCRQVLMAVEDVGVGIEPENTIRLFCAFYTNKPAGLGIGLSICRSIVEAHGGRIFASRNAAPGMTFQFTVLPCNPASSAASMPSADQSRPE